MEPHYESLSPRPFSIAEWSRLVSSGIFGDERVELLKGVVFRMTPQEPPHAFFLTRLSQQLWAQLDDRFSVRVQSPLTLMDESEPEPDLCVVSAGEEDSAPRHPRHAALVVEVADSTLEKDRGLKLQLYGRAGLPEYWIVQTAKHEIEVLTDPDRRAARYRSSRRISKGALKPQELAGVVVEVAALFRRQATGARRPR